MKLRAAIAGAGLMGYWHARSAVRAGGLLVGVFDLEASAAARLARQFGGVRPCSSLTQLLEETRCDVLHICTPPATHFDLASSALKRGIHLIIEKPMTPRAPETERLYSQAAERQLLVCPVHQFIFQRGVQKARSALPSIGRLLHVAATFCSAGAEGKNAQFANSVVADILPHPLSLMRFFSPASLDAGEWVLHRPCDGELRATLFHERLSGSILISMHGRPTTASLLLLGTRGTIHVDLFHGFCVIECGTVSRLQKILHPFQFAAQTFAAATGNLARRSWTAESAYPGLRELISSAYNAVRGVAPQPIPREEACTLARVRDEILRGSGLALEGAIR
jgi:predicted dehydrogenase